MATYRYLGPAETFNGTPVPADGIDVTLDEATQRALVAHGHVFAAADGTTLTVEQPTPQELNAAANEAASTKPRGKSQS